MKDRLLKFLDVEPDEAGRVGLLFIMGIFMGLFLATVSVAAQAIYLSSGFSEAKDLPVALFKSGIYALIATVVYNFLQNRIPFPLLASICLLYITGTTAFIEFGDDYFTDKKDMIEFSFTQVLPFTFLISLVFWGSFGRLFNLKQSKRLVGTVDIGAMLATFISFFSIPFLLTFIAATFPSLANNPEYALYPIGLVSIIIFFVMFVWLSFGYINKTFSFATEKKTYKKLGVVDFVKNRYILYMSVFVITSMVAINFVDFSFLNVATQYFEPTQLANFISLFEATIVIFSFLVDVFGTDKINSEYGMRVSLLVNPALLILLTGATLGLGFGFGYDKVSPTFLFFFMGIALSKLFIRSLREALDSPTFKLYLLPIESNIRIDVQTKIEGIVTALATVVSSGLIILISRVEIFSDLIYISAFTIPFLVFWFISTNSMHKNYKETLQQTLVKNKEKGNTNVKKEFTVNSVLEKEIGSTVEEKVIYGLKLMEKLEPALFENAIFSLAESNSRKLRTFAEEKINELGIEKDGSKSNNIKSLAQQALGAAEDSDLLSISVDNLMKLSKSIKQNDRLLAAKLLRKMVSARTIFILLELLRDVDPKVRFEALITARKTKRPEAWPILIEMLSSPSFGHHAAAAIVEAGEPVLASLEAAFHKSGQTDLIMLRIVQIMGRIGGDEALKLLWKKADYPDKRIVKQILYSLRYINYRAQGREAIEVMELLDAEMSKTIWNMVAITELPENEHFHFLREALREEVQQNFDHITLLLSLLYDPESIQLVRENVESGDPDNIAFALELLDLFVAQELKPKLFPLLDDSPTEDKLEALQTFFPRENYHPIQVINYVLNRDFNQNNRWTKACSVHAAAYLPEFRVSRGLIAQVFNNDRLLQETSAWVMYNKDKKAYAVVRERLPQRDRKFIDSSIENNQLLDGLDDGFFLGIEMVMFLKTLNVFKGIHGNLLADLADRINAIELFIGESVKFSSGDVNAPIFIVAHGEVTLKNNDSIVSVMKKGDVYGDLFQDGAPAPANIIEARERSIIFRINLVDFYFVMSNHHDLVQGLIKNITTKEKESQPIE